MQRRWKLWKKERKETEGTFSDWLTAVLTDERTLNKMACSMSTYLESENTDVPFCMM